jgi:hypothetical protein
MYQVHRPRRARAHAAAFVGPGKPWQNGADESDRATPHAALPSRVLIAYVFAFGINSVMVNLYGAARRSPSFLSRRILRIGQECVPLVSSRQLV